MSVLDRKVARDLFRSKGPLAAIILIVAVGIACFVCMSSAYNNLETSRRAYYAQCRMADFSVEVKKAPLSELDRLASIPGITELRPRIVFPVTVDLDDVAKPLSGQVLSLPAKPAPVINNIQLKRGSYFTPEHRPEVIVNDAFAQKRNIHPGQRIHLILNNRRQELFVVGTAISSEFVYLLGPGGIVPEPESFGVFYLKERYAEEVFDFEGAFNQVIGLLAANRSDQTEEILQRIETCLEPYGVASTTPLARQASHWFLTSEIAGLRVSTIVLPAIFLSVAALILNVLMTRMAEQQRTVVGTLKALGYSNQQVLWHFLKFGLAVGTAGSLLGCVLGYLLAGGMTVMYRQFFQFPNLVNRPYTIVWLAGIAIGVLFSLLGTVRGVGVVLRLSPAEAMRPKPPRRGGRVWIEHWHVLWNALGFRWRMVIRGIIRARMRTTAGIFAAAMGAALMLLAFYFRDAMYYMVDFQFDKLLVSDFDLTFKDDRSDSAWLDARTLPGVDHVEPQFIVGCTFHHGHHRKKGAITGLVPAARLTVPRDTAGRQVPVPSSGLLMTRMLAELLEARPGDRITIVPTKGLRQPTEVTVTQIIDSYLGLAAYADFHYLNRLVHEESAVSGLQLKVCPGPDSSLALYRELKRMPALQSVNAVREQKASIVRTLLDSMIFTITMIIGFAGIIFFGSILNSSLISLSERQTEIGTFRVLGYGPHEVGMIFLQESLLVNSVGLLIGLPLGYWLSLLLCQLYDTELFRIPQVIRPAGFVWTSVLAVVFTLAAHYFVQRAINKMDWLEALKVKE